MKEDVLEQLVEDWLQSQGYFTRANLKFKPSKNHKEYNSKKDSVPSDIDVIGIHPTKSGADAVLVVGCKSWQGGFRIQDMTNALVSSPGAKRGNKDAWKHFRELVVPKWTEAFHSAVMTATGREQFTYVTAVTKVLDRNCLNEWAQNTTFKEALKGNPIRIVTLRGMLQDILPHLTTTVESSHLGRTLQLFKAAGLSLNQTDARGF